MAVSIKIMKPTLGCANQKSNLTRKQASMARVEEAATMFFAKPPKERNTLEYVSGKSPVFFFTRSTALPTKDTRVSKEIDLKHPGGHSGGVLPQCELALQPARQRQQGGELRQAEEVQRHPM